LEELENSAGEFREKFKISASQFSASHVFNTDQVGFNYEVSDARTLSWKGEKRTWGFGFSPKNKSTHSYTTQPITSLDGGLVPQLYVCLQEKEGKFGPLVQQRLFKSPNLVVTCSTSGKLATGHVAYFMENVVKPNVKEDFSFTYDHWRVQMKEDLYEDFGKNGLPACKSLVTPEGCTGLVQPLDRIYNRQYKYVVRRISNEASICGIDLTDRNSVLKVQSIVQYMMSAKSLTQ